MYQRPTDQFAHMDPQTTALRMGGDLRGSSDLPMEVPQLFVVGGQEAGSGHRFPMCVGWTERIVMVGGTETVLALGQEISFHRLTFVFTPRMFHHHESVITIGGVSVKS